MRRGVLLLVGLLLVGCWEIDQDEYARENNKAFESIPAPPGSSLLGTTLRENSEEGRLNGYWTDKVYALRGRRPVRRAIRFYDRVIAGQGDWEQVSSSSSFGSYTRGDDFLHILGSGRHVTVSLDHDCC